MQGSSEKGGKIEAKRERQNVGCEENGRNKTFGGEMTRGNWTVGRGKAERNPAIKYKKKWRRGARRGKEVWEGKSNRTEGYALSEGRKRRKKEMW